MTFSQDDNPRNSQTNQAFNFLKKKGLGWVPDLPDRRDYNLFSEYIQIEKRLKRSKNAEWIEDIGDNLIQVIKSVNQIVQDAKIGAQFQPEQIKVLKDLPDKLRAKIFGEITFEYIKLYKTFRNSYAHPDVIKLKIYLSILGYREFFKINGTEFKKYADKGKTHTEWYTSWINSEKFEDDTFELVKSFQQCVGLDSVDGVVGLKTYISLRESFKYSGQNESDFSAFKNELRKETERTKIVPIPTIWPRPFLESVFKELKQIAVRQIRQEIDCPNDLFEKETLHYLQLKEILSGEDLIFENIFKGLKQGIELEKILHEYGFNSEKFKVDKDHENLLRIIQAEYSVIAPVLEFILKVICPLARHQKDIPTSVSWAIELLKNRYLSLEDLRKNLLFSPTKDILQDYSDTVLEELQQFAVQSVNMFCNLFRKQGLNSVISERRSFEGTKREDFKSTLCFYYLLCKLVKTFESNTCTIVNVDQVIELGKTELFRIENSQSVEESTNCELFTHPKLAIPFNNNFHASINDSDNKIPYFFLPGIVDLSYWCSAIEDQGKLNACSAFAGVALLEYFANRSDGQYVDASPLFLYKTARNLMQASGDVGASLRATMKAMEKFGVPPIQYWPYLPDKVDEEPPQFCYSFAQNYQALKYFRLDYAGISEETLLSQIKTVLAAGFPCVFGFTLYASVDYEENVRKGWIPIPTRNERLGGGHAVVAVGYSDFETVGQKEEGTRPGAFLIRNSWGTDWGRGGYGWLPYDYVLQGLTADWWSLLRATWFEQDSFGMGASDPGGGYPPGVKGT